MRHILFLLFLTITWYSCGGSGSATTQQASTTEPSTPMYGYRIKSVHPHSTTSYTQGLLFVGDRLIESCGGYKTSKITEVDLTTGNQMTTKELDNKYFGEGAALFDDKLYQLTWMEGTLFMYDATSLKPLGEKSYAGEGWGLTSDDKYLYMSDGTHRITVRNPATFDVVRTIDVTNKGSRVTNLNELEWIDGQIWANVFMSELIVRIDPQSGNVVGIIDLEGILPQSDRTPQTDVLNGIAYQSSTKRIFVTGKNWNKLFEIELTQR